MSILLKDLKKLIGEVGAVEEAYGGYEITINDADNFPWLNVFNLLLGASYDVWITRRADKLVILSKPFVE